VGRKSGIKILLFRLHLSLLQETYASFRSYKIRKDSGCGQANVKEKKALVAKMGTR
jgi:hypothetical protein